MPVYQLATTLPFFPHPLMANPDGLLAVGGDLNADWLYTAYANGIFPWFGEDQPILWWFPRPRAVLYPGKLKISKSLRATMRRNRFHVTFDEAFDDVITACAVIKRKGQDGTWILPEMISAYNELHDKGIAHSVELWEGDTLVGGLYGIWLGRIFFGESMFSRRSDASKIALVKLVERLCSRGLALIDCQQDTRHMRSLGAETVEADHFYLRILENQRDILIGQQDF